MTMQVKNFTKKKAHCVAVGLVLRKTEDGNSTALWRIL